MADCQISGNDQAEGRVSEGTDALQLVVVAVYAAGWDERAVDGFRYGVTEVVQRVEQRLKENHSAVEVQATFLNSEEASEEREWQSVCTVAVLDVSESDEKLALHAGRLQGARVPVIFVGDMKSESIAKRLNCGTSSPVLYRAMNELFQSDSAFETEIFRAVPAARIQEELIFRFWFPQGTSTIWVVCPQDHYPSEYADSSNPDYTYLDKLGDQDALLELMVFLSRHYPNATIEHFYSGNLPTGHTSGNLVVIGGPGSPSDISNRVCKEMMEAVHSRISYSDGCEQMKVRTDGDVSLELSAEFHDEPGSGAAEHRRICEDVGYFARFPNPLNKESTVVLVNGIHTTGVLGAARAFSERRDALANFHTVLRTGASLTGFECYFKVPVLSGNIRVPSVGIEQIFRVSSSVSDPPSSREQPTSEVDSRSSVKILFIAGDRGGSQLNQLQIPKEYDEIQGALRASEHRDLISLGTPILACTREKLAYAYRHRPKVVHFAGHGNERSLSIIEDHHLLVSEAAFTAKEFLTVLKTMKEDVVLCVLNACESEGLARELVDEGGTEYAVGWPSKVSDSTAITFSRVLYGTLGDGQTMCAAFNSAKVACGPREVPVLIPGENAPSGPLVGGKKEDR